MHHGITKYIDETHESCFTCHRDLYSLDIYINCSMHAMLSPHYSCLLRLSQCREIMKCTNQPIQWFKLNTQTILSKYMYSQKCFILSLDRVRNGSCWGDATWCKKTRNLYKVSGFSLLDSCHQTRCTHWKNSPNLLLWCQMLDLSLHSVPVTLTTKTRRNKCI